MKYFNVIVIGALVIYLAYRMYQDVQMGNKDNLLLRSLVLLFGIGLFLYRILQIRKTPNDRY